MPRLSGTSHLLFVTVVAKPKPTQLASLRHSTALILSYVRYWEIIVGRGIRGGHWSKSWRQVVKGEYMAAAASATAQNKANNFNLPFLGYH